MTTVERHRQVLRELDQQEHEERLAGAREDLERARSQGFDDLAEFCQDRIDRFNALPRPWQQG